MSHRLLRQPSYLVHSFNTQSSSNKATREQELSSSLVEEEVSSFIFESSNFVLPRPDQETPNSPTFIKGPSEQSFVDVFSSLLPAARYLDLKCGKAAYYEITSISATINFAHSHRVLVIHSVQTPALGMLPLTRALRGSFHFVLVDLWGHGLSDTPNRAHESSLFYALIGALLDILQWPSAHLIGFSFGGALTAGYTALKPQREQSFVLIAPAGLIRSAEFTASEQALLRGANETAAREFVLEWLEGGDLIVPTDWRDRVAQGEVVAEAIKDWQMREHVGHTASIVAIVRDGGPLDSHENFHRAFETGIPYLAILGGIDGICSEEQLADVGLPNVAVIPGAGHGVVREKAPELAALISEFWSSVTGPKTIVKVSSFR